MAAYGSIDIGVDLLDSRRDETTHALMCQTGDVISEETENDDVELWQHVGLVSRPPKAEPKRAACQGVLLHDTGHSVCIATRDLRGQELAGALKYGETCLYAAGDDGKGQARVLLKADSSIALYTRKSESGAGMALLINPEADEIRLVNAAGYGLVINGDGITLTAKDAALTLASGGDVTLAGTGQTQVDGATIVLGSAIISPAANAALKGPTGMSGSASLKVLIQ